jgi:mannitol/fructose-specific phosphotransferase system IIA component (Ntr-type)
MIPIGDVLQPDHVNLALTARDSVGAVEELLTKLDGDERVKNLAILREAVLKEAAPAISENGCGICIAHGRTESVTSLVMAAGRSTEGVRHAGLADPVMLVFVAGIPGAFTSEYLRIVGAIVRMCRDKRQLHRLLVAKDAERFVALLGSGEVKL